MWPLILVMLIAGTFGGVMNYFLTRSSDPSSNVIKSIVLGTGASLLVPLFLNMISSNLVEVIQGTSAVPGDRHKILVFAGFCLVASISSTAFIRSLSDRVLTEAKEARRAAKQATAQAIEARQELLEVQTAIEPIVSREVEQDDEETISALSPVDGLSDVERSVLVAFIRSRYAHRSVSGLARDVEIDKTELRDILVELSTRGFVSRGEGAKGRWYITAVGRRAVQAT